MIIQCGVFFENTHLNKTKKKKKEVQRRFFFSFFYLFPGVQPTPAPKTSAWFLASYGAPKRTMPQTWQEPVEEEVPNLEEVWVEGGERKKEVKWRGAGCQDGGFQNRTTTENPLSPCLYPTTPLTQGPARPIPPLHITLLPSSLLLTTTHPHSLTHSLTLPAIFLHFVPHWNKLHTLTFKVEEKKRAAERHLCCSSNRSWWINCINNGQLGANL